MRKLLKAALVAVGVVAVAVGYLAVQFPKSDGSLGVALVPHVAAEVAKNTLMGIPAVSSWRTQIGRTTSSDQAQQIRDQFAFFMGTLGDVHGKTIVEVGPGDSIGLAALFLRAGAAKYIAYDRFIGDIYGPSAMALYDALGNRNFQQFVTIRGIGIEAAEPTREADIVVSFDVVEHLSDPVIGLERMAGLLKPGGVMVHRVDYSAHDIWRTYEEKQFLKFPDWLWHLMGSNRGYSNRVRHAVLMKKADSLGLKCTERIPRKFADGDALVAEYACAHQAAPTLGPAYPY